MLSDETLEYLSVLEQEFVRNGDALLAQKQSAYLRNHFTCFGITTPKRRLLQSPFLQREALPPRHELHELVQALWKSTEREYHYFAQELALKYVKRIAPEDLALYEYMVVHQSWWDTVDFIANKLIGNYFTVFPNEKKDYVDSWLHSGNIWLQRSALLFQLKYKDKTDLSLLSSSIQYLLGTNEFFIDKAIGWVLREYSRTNPEWVIEFVSKTRLSSLSEREALRRI